MAHSGLHPVVRCREPDAESVTTELFERGRRGIEVDQPTVRTVLNSSRLANSTPNCSWMGFQSQPQPVTTGAMRLLADVVQHYNQTFNLRLTPTEISNLVEYLKSL
jgi:hypothetical protein